MNTVQQANDILIADIKKWKEERKAVILAHNYQLAEIQDIADFTGDSLELARKAAFTSAQTIVFCGVRFMAESAGILSPDKTVLLPVAEAGCPMADMVTARTLKQVKAEHPDAAVVAYVNSSAEVKAESDYCCTSANAVTLVNAIPEKKILFVPDRNLGHWVSKHTDKEIIFWDGFCATHDVITLGDIEQAKNLYPKSLLMVHPECQPKICDQADAVLSTSQMVKFAEESEHTSFIVGTETGLLHTLKKVNPEKFFYPLNNSMVCPNMKLTALPDLLNALIKEETKIEVSSEIRIKAVKALEAMIQYG